MTLPKMLILLAAALAFSAMAQASRWQLIGKSDKSLLYVDTQSIGRVGNRVKIWVKQTYAQPEEVPGLSSRKAMQSSKVLFSFDCSARTLALLELIYYADIEASGNVVESASVEDKPSGYRNVAPESGAELLFNYACHP